MQANQDPACQESIGHEASGDRAPDPSFLSTWVNLMVSAVGVGVLSLPFAVKLAGVYGCLVLSALIAIMNGLTLARLVNAASMCGHACRTYDSVMLRLCGVRWARLTSIVLLLNQFGSLIGFYDVLLDLSVPVMMRSPAVAKLPSSSIRAMTVFVIGTVLLLPLSLLSHIHSLSCSSFISVCSCLITAGVVVVRGTQSAGDIDWTGTVNVLGMIKSLPILVYSVNCHVQLIPIYTEMRSYKRHTIYCSIAATLSFCITLYLSIGICGFRQFGIDTPGDILKAYSGDDTVANAARVAMAAHIALGYPVVMYPLLRSFEHNADVWRALWRKCEGCRERGQGASVGVAANGGPRPLLEEVDSIQVVGARAKVNAIASWQRIMLHYAIIVSTGALAIVLPQVQVVFSAVGGLAGSTLVYLLPSVLALRVGYGTKAFNSFVIIFGIFIALVCTALSLASGN